MAKAPTLTIECQVDTQPIDEAIEKAERLIAMLDKAHETINLLKAANTEAKYTEES